MTARTPYQDTSIPVERSKEQIREALRAASIRKLQIKADEAVAS